jgi:two-component system response regulator DevR
MTGQEGSPIRIFLVDDHEVVLDGLRQLLSTVDDFEVVGVATTAREARVAILAARPDVAVLDVRLPDGSGIEVCRHVRSARQETYCLMLTSHDDHDAVLASVLAGASGYVLKEVRTAGLIDAIRQVALGRSLIDPAIISRVMDRVRETSARGDRLSGLTRRERDVLDLLAEGLTNREIGDRMFLAEKTVKNYVSNVLAKLGVNRRSQAAVIAADVRHVRGDTS